MTKTFRFQPLLKTLNIRNLSGNLVKNLDTFTQNLLRTKTPDAVATVFQVGPRQIYWRSASQTSSKTGRA